MRKYVISAVWEQAERYGRQLRNLKDHGHPIEQLRVSMAWDDYQRVVRENSLGTERRYIKDALFFGYFNGYYHPEG